MRKPWIKLLLIGGVLTATLMTPATAASPVMHVMTDTSDPLDGKTVTINLKNATVKHFLDEMKRQTGADYLCASDLLKTLPTVGVNVQNEPARDVLYRVLGQLGCAYRVNDGIVMITAAQRDKREISGRIIDEVGDPLPGVPVKVKGSSLQTITDADGYYRITVPTNAPCTLEVSYLGMRETSATCQQGTANCRCDMRMMSDNALQEVVVTGYQTISRERATGAYDIISGDELRSRHADNLAKALDGLVPGMQSTDDGRGGKTFTIRGTSTLMADNTPLVVVDGFPVTDNPSSGQQQNPNLSALERLNPDNIESITVLKDAAAASIWGARSANGVIVITTRKARKNQPLEINASTQLTIEQKQDPWQLTGLASSAHAVAYEKWAFENSMVGDPYTGDLSSLYYAVSPVRLLLYQGYLWGTMTKDETDRQLAALAAQDNTSQLKKYILPTAVTSQTNVSLSTGMGPWTTYATVQYEHDKGGFVGHSDNTWKMDWNNTLRATKRLSFSLGLNFVAANRHNSQIGISDLSDIAPYEMLLNADGSYASHFHPSYNTDVLNRYDWTGFTYGNMNYNLLQDARTRTQRTTNSQLRTQLGMEWEMLDGLKFNSKFQYEHSNFHRRNVNGEESFYTRFNVNRYTPGDMQGHALGTSAVPAGAIVVKSDGCNHSALFRNDLSLDRIFGEKHAVAAVVGNEISNYYYTSYTHPYLYGVTATSAGQPGPDGYVDTMDGSMSTVSGVPANGKKYVYESWNHNRFVSFYGNVSYMYDDRYGISASARSDASNLITDEAKYRWSPLWSVGGMWNMANEQWMKGKTPFDRLTLRMTYGKNGNAATSSSARTTINTSASSVDEYTGFYPGSIADYGNPSLRWEKTAIFNVGLDFSMLNNHLYGSVEFYNKKSTDVLGNVSIASVHGTSYATFNNAALTNRGVEVQLGGNVDAGQVRLSANLAYAYNRNRVSELYTELTTVTDMLNASYVTGYAMMPIFTFNYGGLVDGVPTVVDKQGNHIGVNDYSLYEMNADDLLTYQGKSIAPHTASLSLQASWKGFTATAYFNGRFGGKMIMPTFNYYTIDKWGGKINTTAPVEDLINADGTLRQGISNAFPLPTTSDDGTPIDVNTYSTWSYLRSAINSRIESSDYIYFSELDLNYTLPASLFGRGWVKGVDVYGKLENIGLLYAANSKDYHPDYLPGMQKPTLSFTLGANIKF